jgi:type IV fimbrial biogenesis protein FimT
MLEPLMTHLPRQPTHGLTVIELMVVVAMVGVLIALAAPSMRGLMSTQRVKSINAELVTDLQFARGEAARRNRDVHMRFRATDNCYVVYVDNAGPGNCNCSRTPGENVCTGGREEIKTVQIPVSAGVALSASSATGQIVRFEGLSGTSLPDDFQVSVAGESGGQLRTVVNQAGRPTVCTPDGSISGTPAC